MLRDLKELEESEPFNRGIVRMADEPEETDIPNDEYRYFNNSTNQLVF